MNYAAVINRAQAAGVQLVRFLYCDHSGVTRGKAIHVSHLEHKLREGLGLTRAQMAMNLLEQLIDIEGMEPVGEIRLVPDPETFSVLPWTPSSASLICDQLDRSEEHTSELQSHLNLVCRLLLEKKNSNTKWMSSACTTWTA